MQHIQGGDRNQTLLLPVAVDDYVGRENPVRFIEAFVDQCDLQQAGFRRVQPKDTGRPGYDPADLLKLYIYGYVNRLRSSRRPEVETARNLEVMWLLRGLRPDFKTIADFRKAVEVPLPRDRQRWRDARLLPRRPAQRQGRQALPCCRLEVEPGLDAAGHQY